MSDHTNLVQQEWTYTVDDITDGRDFHTDEPVRVARIVCSPRYGQDCILLASQRGGRTEWEPTWIGPIGNAVQMPRGFLLPNAVVDALAVAVSGE